MPDRFQFGVGQLLWLSTVVAVTTAVAAKFELTATARGLLAGYLGVICVWLVIRGPAVAAGFGELRRRRRELRERRRALVAEVAARREHAVRQPGELNT